MAVHGIVAMTVPTWTSINLCRGRASSAAEMNGVATTVMFSRPVPSSLASRLSTSIRTGRSDGRLFADGKQQCVESWAVIAAKHYVKARPSPEVGGVDSDEFETFQARGWSKLAYDKGALLNDESLADLRSWEAFANGGEITEKNMEMIVDALLSEEGQSAEDYRCRATMFEKIAEFFSQGRAYSMDVKELSSDSAEVSSAMQRLVDVILAEEGRSATDYNARAQLFAKSAEVFHFIAAEVRSS